MNTLISNVNQVSREWLSQVLGQDVLAIEVNAGDAANWSQNARIVATTQDSPKHLFLKMCQGAAFGDSEVSYCAHDYADLPAAPIPKCYDAVYSAELQAYHILMDDLSATHQDNKHVLPTDRKSTRLNSSHGGISRMPSSA